MKETSRSDKIRNKIQASIELAEAERKRDLFRRRLDLARGGVRAYQLKKFTEAVKAFQVYLKILEDSKGCSEGGLLPSHFDAKRDLPELLLISGIYWDLAKLYDRTASPERYKEFLHYLEKYVAFSKGLPYQPVASETMRKYIAVEKPKHRQEFKNAYKTLAVSNCFVATSLIDLCEETTIVRLREFRDTQLVRHAPGRAFVRAYYAVGPGLAWALDRSPEAARRVAARVLDRIAGRVSRWHGEARI